MKKTKFCRQKHKIVTIFFKSGEAKCPPLPPAQMTFLDIHNLVAKSDILVLLDAVKCRSHGRTTMLHPHPPDPTLTHHSFLILIVR